MTAQLAFSRLSLRWRLTLLYVAGLTGLLLVLGVVQFFISREVLYRNTAALMTADYKAVSGAFFRRPPAVSSESQLLNRLASTLASRDISVQVFGANGGIVAQAPAAVPANAAFPHLRLDDYLNAARKGPAAYYVATTENPSRAYILILQRPTRNGRMLGLVQLSSSTSSLDQTLGRLSLFDLVGSVLVLALAAAATPILLRGGLRPLEQMSRAADAFALGNYKQRVPPGATEDEIGHLANALNGMAKAIDDAFTARQRVEMQLRTFVADASHELRTPLTSIVGYIDVLSRRRDVPPEMLNEVLGAMREESTRMTLLVQDLLILTRLDSGRDLQTKRIELSSWLSATLDELAAADDVAKESRQLEAGICVVADPNLLRIVVVNLLTNARRYAAGSERIWTCFREGNRAVIRLRDNGPGIAREDLPHIFDRFYRGGAARDRITGGSGLGLAIAKSVIEAHDGSIEAEDAPRSGAVLTVWLPLAS